MGSFGGWRAVIVCKYAASRRHRAPARRPGSCRCLSHAMYAICFLRRRPNPTTVCRYQLWLERPRMSILLDSLTSLASPAISQIAGQLRETDAAVTRGLHSSFALVLGSIINKAEDPPAMDRIFELVNTRAASADLATDV